MSVNHKPTCDNPWHAEVSLPIDAEDDEDVLLDYCTKLASESEWLERLTDIQFSVIRDIEEASTGIDF